MNLRGHVPKTCGWPLPYTRIWLSKIREGLAALSCVALHADHLTQRVYYIHQITIIRRWLQYYGRYYRSALYPTMRDLDRDLGPLGQAQIQKAATPSPPGDALDRTHFAPRSEAVRSLADGGVGRGPAGQHRLDADAFGAKFVLEGKTEGKDVCFRRPIYAVERLYLDACGGADVDDRACATLDECRSGGVGEAREGDAVECNHLFHFLDVGIKQSRDGSEAGIVDEQGDAFGSSFSLVSTFARSILLLRSATIEVMWRPLALARLAVSALRGASLRATRIRSYPRFARRS